MSTTEKVFIISPEVIEKAKADKRIVTKLALKLKLPEKEIGEMLEANSPYGKLTTVGAVNIFQQETHIPPGKILVEVGVGTEAYA